MQNFQAHPFKSSDGRTCLHAAVSRGDADQLNCLFENLGPERAQLLTEMDRQGNTVLHLAVRRNRLDMVKRLVTIEPELTYYLNRDNETPIYVAVKLGFLPVVQELVNSCPNSIEIPSKKGKNILHLTVELSQDKILKFLVENVDLSQLINQPDEVPKDYYTQGQKDGNQSRGDSPLLIAARNPDVYMVAASKDNSQAEADGNQSNTSLHIAARNNNVYIVVAPKDNTGGQEEDNQSRGDTPLHIAARNKNDHIVDLLLRVPGVNKDVVNRDGLTPLDIARENTQYYEPYKIIEKLSAYPSRGKPFLYSAPTMTLLKQRKAVEVLDRNFADRRNVELVVATLLATMAFTAVFTIPGGFSSKGASALIGDHSFKLFLIFDCVAFFLALFVMLMWDMSSPFTTRNKMMFIYWTNAAACASLAFTAFSLTAAVYTMLAHTINKVATEMMGSSILLILFGVGVFLYMVARFTVRIARFHRLCGVPYFRDDIIEKCWVVAEKVGMLDVCRSCDYFCHRVIWGDVCGEKGVGDYRRGDKIPSTCLSSLDP